MDEKIKTVLTQMVDQVKETNIVLGDATNKIRYLRNKLEDMKDAQQDFYKRQLLAKKAYQDWYVKNNTQDTRGFVPINWQCCCGKPHKCENSGAYAQL